MLFPPFLLPIAAVLIAMFLVADRRRARGARQTALARALDLHVERPTRELPWDRKRKTTLTGMRRGVRVEIHYFQRSTGKRSISYTRFRAYSTSFGIGLKPKGLVNEAWRVLTGGQDYRLGDPSFDDAITVTGDPAMLSAVLDERTRAAVLAVLPGRSADVAQGMVSYQVRGHVDDVVDAGARLDELAALAASLDRVPDEQVEARLGENVREDGSPGVRQRSLKLLANSPQGAELARESLGDPSPLVRLQAAVLLGDARALSTAPGDTVLALASEDPAGVCGAFAAIGDEEALVRLLSGPAPVRIAAAEGLAKAGSVRAIATLRPLTTGLLADGRVVSAALGAILAIQGRLGDVHPGQVSLAGGESGAVSIAGESGAVSITSAPPRERAE